jgi:hypothetical protein
MSVPNVTLPPLSCPAILLPTPADLRNMFAGLASHAYRYEINSLKSTLDNLRTSVLDIYDPKWEKISIPEIEWEIMMTRLSSEYPMYVQQKILELINTLFPINFSVTILGIAVDILEFLADPGSILDSIYLSGVDVIYDLIPNTYKVWDKFVTADFKKETIRNFFRSEVANKMNLLISGGFTGLISLFQATWNALGLPAFPGLQVIDLEALISGKTVEELKLVEIFGFSLIDLMGGEFNYGVDVTGFQKETLLKRAKEFVEEWQTYLIKVWMKLVATFFTAIGLGALTQWVTFNFCNFLTLIGFPTTIDLPDSVQTSPSGVVSPLPSAA